MSDKFQETTTEFYEWLRQKKDVLPISAIFWSIQPFKKVYNINKAVLKIILKKHGAAMIETTPFYKPYSKLVIL